MDTKPEVAVGPPDDDGLRKVVIDGKNRGRVWNRRELQKVLRRAGVSPKCDIDWQGEDSSVWPAHTWGRLTTGAVMALGFLATAAMCTWIGMKDSFDALTFAGRMTGFIFLLMAIVEVIAFAAGFDYWRKRKMPYSGPTLLLGALVEFFVGATLLALFLANEARSTYVLCLLLWIALTACATWSVWLLCRRRVWKALRNPGRIAVGAVVSTVLVTTNLAYTQIYLPSISRPLMQGTAEIGTASLNREGTKMYLRVRLHLKNSGEVPVHVLGSIYWIHVKLASDPKDTYKLIKPGELVNPPGRELNPGEDIWTDVVAEIENPEEVDYEAVAARVEAYAFRQDRMRLDTGFANGKWRGKLREEGREDDPPGPIRDKKEYFRYQSTISQSSELLNLTRGRERVTVWWLYRRLPALYVDVASPGEKKASSYIDQPWAQVKAVDRYGLAHIRGSLVQTPYAQLLKEAQAKRPK
ncbi:US12 family protein [Streptomyces sp. NRRL F-2664]|uniref:US12 family protein n=1 Tax=Streptomyces sp. NRRL F-2664 TaxID=1463842 RepID=UPI0004C5C1D5|nr:US12 family protein [Streptomyces sp. NRRL F-2664]